MTSAASDVTIRPLREEDLPAADRIVRLAFGTFLGMPEPMAFMGDADYVHNRQAADSTAAFAAEVEGRLVGSNFATNWGSVGFFGPLTIHPDLWERGIAKKLMEPVMERFAAWGTRHAGLFTFAQSPKHVGLYQRFGFWPRFLTSILAKQVEERAAAPGATLASDVPTEGREGLLAECAALTGSVLEGLDLRLEIAIVASRKLGDTVLLRDGSALTGLAVCHLGPGSEAGTGSCYVKFAAVRPGGGAEERFSRLLDACEALGSARGARTLVAGVNTGRIEASRALMARGFRTQMQGIAMHKENDPAYNRPGVYLIDDWR